jgi:hypothetical protein
MPLAAGGVVEVLGQVGAAVAGLDEGVLSFCLPIIVYRKIPIRKTDGIDE